MPNKETLEEFLARGGKVDELEPGRNLEFDAYERKSKYTAGLNRDASKRQQGRAPRQGWWRKGHGSI